MKEIHSWKPRQPSERIARQLFARDGRNAEAVRRTERWEWLTPVAACGLTMLLAVGSMNRPAESLAGNDVTMDFAAEMLNPASSNTMQLVRLSEMDENVQWNVWPKLSPLIASSSALEGEDASATNLTR
jgi:hypothetical protein